MPSSVVPNWPKHFLLSKNQIVALPNRKVFQLKGTVPEVCLWVRTDDGVDIVKVKPLAF